MSISAYIAETAPRLLIGSAASQTAPTADSLPFYAEINIWLLIGSAVLVLLFCLIPERRHYIRLENGSICEMPSVPDGLPASIPADRVLMLLYVVLSTLLFAYSYYLSFTTPLETQEEIAPHELWFNAFFPVIIYSPLLVRYAISAGSHFRLNIAHCFLAAGCVLSVYVFNIALELSGFFHNLVEFTGTPEIQQAIESINKAPRAHLPSITFSAVVAAPVVEEVFFRGFIFRLLHSRVGVAMAALASGLLFGAVHVSLVQMVILSFFGIIQCLLYVKTKSIFYPILMHAIFNGLAMMALFGNKV